MQGDGRDIPADWPENALWRKSRLIEVAADESERFLDLAGFADGRLDPDEEDRVADWLERDALAQGDVAAARELAAGSGRLDAPLAIIARAALLVGGGAGQPGNVIAFPPRPRYAPGLRDLARWSSLAAAMVIAGWLGFALGTDTSRSVAQIGQNGDDGFLQDFLDPSIGFMRDLNESPRS